MRVVGDECFLTYRILKHTHVVATALLSRVTCAQRQQGAIVIAENQTFPSRGRRTSSPPQFGQTAFIAVCARWAKRALKCADISLVLRASICARTSRKLDFISNAIGVALVAVSFRDSLRSLADAHERFCAECTQGIPSSCRRRRWRSSKPRRTSSSGRHSCRTIAISDIWSGVKSAISSSWPQCVPAFPISWTSEQIIDREKLEVRFHHLKALTKGMRVVWTFKETPAGVLVEIVHDLQFRIAPLAPIADQIIGNFFIHHIAGKPCAT